METNLSALPTYERLKSLVPEATALALRERETQFERIVVEDLRLHEHDAFSLALADLLRPNVAHDCSLKATSSVPAEAQLDGLIP